MSARATRAEAVLRRLGNELGLTEAGKLYIENAIDPFPDSRRQLTGYPDAASGASVCPKVKQSVTIAFPGVSPSGTWDLHIFNVPAIASSSSSGMATLTREVPAELTNSFLITSPVGLPVSGLVCAILPTGTNLDISILGDIYPVYILACPTEYQNDPVRIISSAFEVHNPSAELTKQGSIVCYRMPFTSSKNATTFTAAYSGQPRTAFSGVPTRAPPRNTAEALQMADSVQWDAKDGCYIVHALHTTELPTDSWNGCNTMWYKDTMQDDHFYMQGIEQIETVYSVYGMNLMTQFDCGGCILTGLDQHNTILVNYNFQVELFPTPTSPFVNLADPSPSADWRALELVSILHREMPVGVPVDRNGWGDWISSAVDVVRSTIAPTIASVAKMIPHPAAQKVAATISAFAGGGKKAKKKSEEKVAEMVEKKLLKSQIVPSAGTHGK